MAKCVYCTKTADKTAVTHVYKYFVEGEEEPVLNATGKMLRRVPVLDPATERPIPGQLTTGVFVKLADDETVCGDDGSGCLVKGKACAECGDTDHAYMIAEE